MKKIENKEHTKEELIAIFKKQNIPEKWFTKFLEYYKFCYDDLFEDEGDFDDEDLKEEETVQSGAIYCTNLYTKTFVELTDNGHSVEWAHTIAYSILDDEQKIYEAYEELGKKNPELAKKELILHCNNLSTDEDLEDTITTFLNQVRE